MSVINQMLKDLEQRQNEQENKEGTTSNTMLIVPRKNKIGLIIVSTIVLTLLLTYGGYLLIQNQFFIAEKNSQQIPVRKVQQATPLVQQAGVNQYTPTSEATPEAFVLEKSEKIERSPQISISTKQSHSEVTTQMLPSQNKTTVSSVTRIRERIQPPTKAHEKVAINYDNEVIDTPTKKLQKKNETMANSAVEKEKIATPIKTKSSISVSRRQLTTAQLAQQKMAQAEQALSAHDMSKAEKLFEEVLMLKPDNKAARKQLAALWFGRQAYQEALNLLAQGIALDPQYSEFRLMQARIYLTQGYSEQAYQVLQRLSFTHNVEYLATLASVAQQLAKYQQAIESYQQLIKIQPKEARWWLGLAVAYDSNKQYSLALSAYQSAQAQGNLSASSSDFVQQRLRELRE